MRSAKSYGRGTIVWAGVFVLYVTFAFVQANDAHYDPAWNAKDRIEATVDDLSLLPADDRADIAAMLAKPYADRIFSTFEHLGSDPVSAPERVAIASSDAGAVFITEKVGESCFYGVVYPDGSFSFGVNDVPEADGACAAAPALTDGAAVATNLVAASDAYGTEHDGKLTPGKASVWTLLPLYAAGLALFNAIKWVERS